MSYRKIDGKKVKMLSASEAYERVGVCSKTIWNWEKAGWVPGQGHMRHRVYTEYQIRLMQQLKTVIRRWAKLRHYQHARAQIARTITMVHRRWSKVPDEIR